MGTQLLLNSSSLSRFLVLKLLQFYLSKFHLSFCPWLPRVLDLENVDNGGRQLSWTLCWFWSHFGLCCSLCLECSLFSQVQADCSISKLHFSLKVSDPTCSHSATPLKPSSSLKGGKGVAFFVCPEFSWCVPWLFVYIASRTRTCLVYLLSHGELYKSFSLCPCPHICTFSLSFLSINFPSPAVEWAINHLCLPQHLCVLVHLCVCFLFSLPSFWSWGLIHIRKTFHFLAKSPTPLFLFLDKVLLTLG